MAPTCRELIIDAYQVSGLRGTNENPDANDTSIALRMLNYDLIDSLSLDQLWPSYTKVYTWVTESGKWDYTIGVPVGGATPDPDIIVNQDIIRIDEMQVQIGTVWTPMHQISNTDFYRQTTPQGSNIVPSQFAYNKTQDPYNRILLSLGSAGTYNMRISANGITNNYALDDLIQLPSGYYGCLKYGLAELLAQANGLDETAINMRRKFTEMLDRIKLVNAAPAPLLKLNDTPGQWSIGVDRILYGNGGF